MLTRQRETRPTPTQVWPKILVHSRARIQIAAVKSRLPPDDPAPRRPRDPSNAPLHRGSAPLAQETPSKGCNRHRLIRYRGHLCRVTLRLELKIRMEMESLTRRGASCGYRLWHVAPGLLPSLRVGRNQEILLWNGKCKLVVFN